MEDEHLDFGINPWDIAKIVDAGDVPFPKANDNEDCIAQITNFFKKIDNAKSKPISIGGDHSITWYYSSSWKRNSFGWKASELVAFGCTF